MNREQAINYLISSGFTHEQVGEVVRALTYEPARLSVDEVTALAEWTEKLTKECEEAYNKGYADGMKAQEPILDKIRAEIDQYLEIEGFGSEYRNDVKGIIDKYKAENEGRRWE